MQTSRLQVPTFAIDGLSEDGPIWVFIDGDGNAWLRHGLASEDPTPADPLALRLMLQTFVPAIYLGRPCTFGLAQTDPGCHPGIWTVDRYSEQVIHSMALAVAARIADRSLVLVGFSGGGVLALHLAQRLANVVGVLTIAANLDVPRWTERHGYAAGLVERSAPLRIPLAPPVVQLHVFGGRDTNAPHELAAALLVQDPGAGVAIFDAADHDCCWVELWPVIAERFQQLMAASELTRSSSAVR